MSDELAGMSDAFFKGYANAIKDVQLAVNRLSINGNAIHFDLLNSVLSEMLEKVQV